MAVRLKAYLLSSGAVYREDSQEREAPQSISAPLKSLLLLLMPPNHDVGYFGIFPWWVRAGSSWLSSDSYEF